MARRLKIREIAEAKGIDKMALSRRSDVAYRTLQLIWKNPEHDASLSTLEKIAQALEVKIVDLIEEDIAKPAAAPGWTPEPLLAVG